MVETKEKESSKPWWFDSHKEGHSNRSPWLISTLAELEERTKKMLKLIEEDAHSFAKRAEMYYTQRPLLIAMVQDFYRTYRALVERYDQLKSEFGKKLLRTWSSPLSFTKHRFGKTLSLHDKADDSYSEAYGPEEFAESEVDDPEEEETVQDHSEFGNREGSCDSGNAELTRLKEQVERLREENKVQEEQLMQKDEEKRDVIRQLSLAMNMLREENMKLQKFVSEQNSKRESLLGRLFNGFSKS